jgi:serine/threonine protein phosphatase 1
MWEHLTNHTPKQHKSGKRAIVCHTPQSNGEILNLDHVICIDTWCYGDGWLTALDVDTGQYWQADKNGKLRQKDDKTEHT